ncbi:hypothetical protein QBC45DRAFT_435276 [Copromyces sp. CBS 386.78]|nr:hypothetical protein QBC45DRAFT_435276 [Copromyces sp. CBS 386.78]
MAFFQLNCTAGCFSWGQGGQGGSLPSVSSSSTKSSTASMVGVTSSVKTTLTTTKVTSTTKAAVTTTAAAGGQTLWGQCGFISSSPLSLLTISSAPRPLDVLVLKVEDAAVGMGVFK